MRSVINKIFAGVVFIALLAEVDAQQYAFTHYTRDRGIPGNQVYVIKQDSKGYMWFATSSGLIKYNGKDYKTYNTNDGLMLDTPFDITEDKDGCLWIGYDRGVSRLKDGEVKNFVLKESEDRFGVYGDSYGRTWIFSKVFRGDVFYFKDDSLHNFSLEYNFKNQAINNITEDREGGIFFLGRGGKLFKFFANKIDEIILDELTKAGVRYSFFDSENNFILCGNRGIGVIDARSLNMEGKIRWISNIPVNFGLQSKKNTYWFGSSTRGLLRLKQIMKKNNDTELISITEENGLLSNDVYFLCEDNEGVIWIGYQARGVSKLPSMMFNYYGKREGFTSDAILSVLRLDDYLVCTSEKGVFKFSESRFEKIDVNGKFANRGFYSSLATNSGETLIGSDPGLFKVTGDLEIEKIGLNDRVVRTIISDHTGKLWIGTHRGLFSMQKDNTFTKYDFGVGDKSISVLLQVDEKDIYLGTDKGLYIVRNLTVNTSNTDIEYPNINKQLLSKYINDLTIDEEGNLLIATRKGLYISRKDKSILNIERLKNIDVLDIHIDRNKRVWAGTNTGLFLLVKGKDSYNVLAQYRKEDGLVVDEFTLNNTIYEDESGKIYFGSFGGLIVFEPEEEISIIEKPKAYIANVQINDSIYTFKAANEIELVYTQNKLSFIIDGLSYYNEDAVRFEYYMEPIEKEWSNVSYNPVISYGYLEPNDYTFYVRAVNQFGIMSDPQSISFSIAAPFWRQTWFVGLAIVLLVAAGYQVNRVRRNQIRKRNLVLQRIVEEKTKDLKDSKGKIEEQYTELLEVQEELVEKRELEKAHSEIQLLKERLAKENIYLRERHGSFQAISSIIGRSDAIQEVRTKVAEIAVNDSTVLLTGETGVGKNLIAEAIHGLSKRKERALITVNCAAIPDTLVESELFGHEKGSFTGANERREGKFEVADGSTIFLDEIGDMPLAVQAKVLNVFQSRTFTRVGGNEQISTDVRIIAATNHDLGLLVKEGKFRQDLYYRINVYSINIPSLRERQEDIEPIAKYFIDKYAEKLNKKISAVTKSALNVLLKYDYPGNIRELENIIHRAVIICKNGIISDQEIIIQTGILPPENGNGLKDLFIPLEDMERKYIMKVLAKTGGKISGSGGAAEILGMPRSTLRSRMEKLGIKGGGE